MADQCMYRATSVEPSKWMASDETRAECLHLGRLYVEANGKAEALSFITAALYLSLLYSRHGTDGQVVRTTQLWPRIWMIPGINLLKNQTFQRLDGIFCDDPPREQTAKLNCVDTLAFVSSYHPVEDHAMLHRLNWLVLLACVCLTAFGALAADDQSKVLVSQVAVQSTGLTESDTRSISQALGGQVLDTVAIRSNVISAYRISATFEPAQMSQRFI